MGTLAILGDTLKRMRGQRVYFDTAPIIYALENVPGLSDCAIPFLQASGDREFVGFTGPATLAEMLVKPLRDGNTEYAEQLKTLFLSGDVFQCTEHSIEVFILAAALRAKENYRAIDALQLATSINLGCKFFVTNDDSFTSTTTTEIVLLKQYSGDPKINKDLRKR